MFAQLLLMPVSLPQGWRAHLGNKVKAILLSSISEIVSPSSKKFVWAEKKVTIHQDSSIRVSVGNNHIDYKSSYLRSLDDFQVFMQELSANRICRGGPPVKSYPNVPCESTKKDGALWRHVNCDILGDREVCESCLGLHAFLDKKYRTKTRTNQNIKRLYLHDMSPESKKQHHKRQHSRRTRLNRLDRKLQKLQKNCRM